MPDQPTTIRMRQSPRRSRCCGRRSSARITNVEALIHAIRVSVTVTLIAIAWPISVSAEPSSPSRISGSCSPISTNRSALSRNTSVSHTAKPCRRIDALEICGARQPTKMPQVTAASTPEQPRRSAGRYAA